TPPAGDGGPVSRRGTYAGGSYLIEVPGGWNGGLVIFAHGNGEASASPLASHLAANGYAWAASSYRSGDYPPACFLDDTLQVRDLFIREIGRPRWTIIHGQSMGGHVAISSLELHPGVYQGALIECGVTDGVTVADLGLAYQAAAEYFAGAPLLDDTARPDLAARVSELWLPALGEPGRYTVQGARFDNVVKHLFGGDLPLRLQGLRPRYFPNMILFRRTETLGRAGSTLHIRYRIDPGLGVDEDELNRKIRRFAPAVGAAGKVILGTNRRSPIAVLTPPTNTDTRTPFSTLLSYPLR